MLPSVEQLPGMTLGLEAMVKDDVDVGVTVPGIVLGLLMNMVKRYFSEMLCLYYEFCFFSSSQCTRESLHCSVPVCHLILKAWLKVSPPATVFGQCHPSEVMENHPWFRTGLALLSSTDATWCSCIPMLLVFLLHVLKWYF